MSRSKSPSDENNDPNPVSAFAFDKKVTALDKERAKNMVLSRQFHKATSDNESLHNELRRTQQLLENQMKQTLQLRKQQQSQNELLEKRRLEMETPNEQILQGLENQLKNTQVQLASEMSLAQQREAKLQKAIEQSAQYEKELHQLKQQQVKDEGNALAVKRLEMQRDELLVVVKKQMKLIDILKQQALHARAATLLDITEKDFLKEWNLK
jgi:hypothetical protein